MRHIGLLVVAFSLLPACRCQTESAPANQAVIPPATGSIAGTVRLSGDLKPDPRMPWGIPQCGNKPIDLAKLKTLVLGEGQTMANVYVAVKSGLGDRRFPTPDRPVLLDQVGCVYEPRVMGLMTGQSLVVRNSDDTMHSVHINARSNPSVNVGQPERGRENTFHFPKPERPIMVSCDVHPWMQAWVHVSEHPFFAVTPLDGKYTISGLPPGSTKSSPGTSDLRPRRFLAESRSSRVMSRGSISRFWRGEDNAARGTMPCSVT